MARIEAAEPSNVINILQPINLRLAAATRPVAFPIAADKCAGEMGEKFNGWLRWGGCFIKKLETEPATNIDLPQGNAAGQIWSSTSRHCRQ